MSLAHSCGRLTAFLILSFLVSACSPSAEQTHRHSLQQAREAFRAKHYDEALTFLNRIDKQVERTPEYYLIQGASLFKLEDFRQAVTALSSATPRSAIMQTYIAYLSLLVGDSDRANTLAMALARQHTQHADVLILQGNIALKEHRYTAALSFFQSALSVDPLSVKAYIGMANTFLLQRHFLKAEEHYLHALLRSNGDTSPYIALIHFYIAMKRYDEAESMTQLALSIFPQKIDFFMILSNIYIKRQDIQKALDIFQNTLALYPQSIDLKIRIIKCYFYLNKFDDSLPLINSLLLGGSNYFGLTLLSEYYLRKNDFERALINLNKAMRINNNSYLLNYYLGLINLLQKNHRASIQFLRKSIHNHPGFLNSNLLLSVIYLHGKKFSLAGEYAKIALQISPNNLSAHLINGLSLYFSGYINEFNYELDAAELFTDDHYIIDNLKTEVSFEGNDYQVSSNLVDKIPLDYVNRLFWDIELYTYYHQDDGRLHHSINHLLNNQDNYLSLVKIGQFYRHQGNLNRARFFFRRAIEINPKVVIPYYELAHLEVASGSTSVAMAYLSQALQINPYFIKAYKALGSLHEQHKDYQSAKAVYAEGLLHAPEDSELLNNLAWVDLVHVGDKAAAYVNIRKAVGLRPDDPDIQDTLAWWHYLNDDPQQAMAILQKLVASHPSHALYVYHLGLASLKAGAKAQALVQLRRALALGLDEEYRVEAEKLIP